MTIPGHPAEHPRIYRLPEAALEVWSELEFAHRLIHDLGSALRSYRESDLIEASGPPLSGALSPFRCLLLAAVGRQSVFGVRPRRLARLLRVSESLLSYHLSALESGRLLRRERHGVDGRRVTVHLTWTGGEALARAARVLSATQLGLAAERKSRAQPEPRASS